MEMLGLGTWLKKKTLAVDPTTHNPQPTHSSELTTAMWVPVPPLNTIDK